MLSLWLGNGMFWVPKQRLVEQVNIIPWNRWMTEVGIEKK